MGGLRLFGLLIGPPHGLGRAAQTLAQAQERVLLGLFLFPVHLVGEELLAGVPKYPPHQVGGGLKPGAHAPLAPEIAHPGHQDVVALAHQRRHMAQVDFQRQAGLVNGQGGAPVQDIPVGGGADCHLHAQLLEKGAPQRIVAVIQQGPGQADGYCLFIHIGNPLCVEMGGRAAGINKKRGTPTACLSFGARGGSRTRTPLRALAPEASESTNSTTRAFGS